MGRGMSDGRDGIPHLEMAVTGFPRKRWDKQGTGLSLGRPLSIAPCLLLKHPPDPAQVVVGRFTPLLPHVLSAFYRASLDASFFFPWLRDPATTS